MEGSVYIYIPECLEQCLYIYIYIYVNNMVDAKSVNNLSVIFRYVVCLLMISSVKSLLDQKSSSKC